MKKIITLLVLFVSCLTVRAQEIYYEKVDTCKVQLVVSRSEVTVYPTYGSYFGKNEWDIILKNKREFENLEEISEILSLFDFTVTRMEWTKNDLIIDLEKHARTTTTIRLKKNEKG